MSVYQVNRNTGATSLISGIKVMAGIPRKVINDTSYSTALEADTFYKFGTLTSFALAVDDALTDDPEHYHEWMFEFTSGTTPTTFTYASGLSLWDSSFTVKASKKYQGSVVEGVIVMCEVG